MDGGVTTGAGLDQAAGLLGAARRIVVFSGAGISTDSRIEV
jgi:NAD-dependent SIR2 family protein deacetylase